MPPRQKATPPAEHRAPRIHPKLLDRVVPIETLVEYYKNANEGDIPEIRRSLRVNGQYKTITVNVGTITGRANEILAGNHTWIAARQEGWPDIAVDWVDVDDKAAARIVAVDNRTAEKAKRDPEKLVDLLGLVDGDLEGTGYTEADLAKLLGSPTPADADDESDMAGEQRYSVLVECRDETQQLDLLAKFEAEGLDARALVQ